MRQTRSILSLALLGVVLIGTGGAGARAADVKIKHLRIQRVGDDTYFRLQLSRPVDLAMPQMGAQPMPALRWQLARLPRLIPQDDTTASPSFVPDNPDELEFVGRALKVEGASFVLLYPVMDQAAALDSSA